MRKFKTKLFNRWSVKEGLTDAVLLSALKEIVHGLVDANLGGHVYKKRVRMDGRGKRGGARTPVSYTHLDVYKRQLLSHGQFLLTLKVKQHQSILLLRTSG